jgi:GPH family glycoside/pentoside/hexuronide:cation symporter
MTHDDAKLKWTAKLIYGVGDVGNAMVVSAIAFFLLAFYTDGALISPALAGTALAVAKIWDAVNDPLFGWISDRTKSTRFGKRRVYMIFGALPLALTVALLWFVPQGLSDAGTFVWILVSFILFDTMLTLTSVPYYALTPELTTNYDERASLTTWRMALGVPAYLVGVAATPIIVGLFALKRSGYAVVGIIYGVVNAISLLGAAAGIRERKETSESQSQTPPLRAFLLTFKNRPFVRLIVAYLVVNIAFTLIQTLLYYLLTYQLGMAEGDVSIVLALLLVSVGVFLFPWKMISDRTSKGPAYAVGLLIGGLAVVSTFFLPKGPSPWIYVIAIVAGLGFSTNWVFPWAMVPDVVEYDQLETGEHRAGMYYGVWGFTQKLTQSLGIALSGWVLQLFGYVKGAAVQSDMALLGIRLFIGPIPLLIFVLMAPLLLWYPITRATHAEVLRQLVAKDRAAAGS